MSQKTEQPTDELGVGVGHNSNAELKSFVERLERLEEEKQSFVDDIKDVCAEAKGKGYDPKALKAAVKHRRMTSEKREAQKAFEATKDAYFHALGMLD